VINVAIGEHQTDHGDTDEYGAIGFKQCEVANPGTAHAERDEYQRPQAAERRQESGRCPTYECQLTGFPALTDIFPFVCKHTLALREQRTLFL
jgi:hypothetical protein